MSSIKTNEITYAVSVCKDVYGLTDIDNDVYIYGVLSALSTLSEKEQKVMLLLYKQNLTLRQAGSVMDYSGERIRQLKLRAISKLRHPSRSRTMLVSNIILQSDKYKNELEEVSKAYKTAANELAAIKRLVPEDILVQADTVYNEHIADLNLSVRLYNCLMKSNILTVHDILCIRSLEELMSLKNLGKKCVIEIRQRMNELGFSDWADSMVDK